MKLVLWFGNRGKVGVGWFSEELSGASNHLADHVTYLVAQMNGDSSN